MATTVLPDLIDALVTQGRAALDGVLVYDGFGVDAEPGNQYLMVGVEDVDANRASWAATSEQTWANANHTSRDEEGVVVCAALSWNGDSDPKAARDSAFAVVGAVEDMCRANPSLGLANLLWTSAGHRLQLSQDQSESGAIAIVVFHIRYRARI